jgi:hypothetical protein
VEGEEEEAQWEGEWRAGGDGEFGGCGRGPANVEVGGRGEHCRGRPYGCRQRWLVVPV